MADAEHAFALLVAVVGIVIGGYYLWTGRFTAGAKNRPVANAMFLLRTTPVRFHPLTTRFIGLVIFGLGVLLLVRVFT